MSHDPPRIGFVSLGCPKALVDSERILTQLRIEGYDLTPSYDDATLVVVNTCGFIDAAKEESLEAIGEALRDNGRVIVTGCLGANEEAIRAVHPAVLSISGPQRYEAVLSAVHAHAPMPRGHNPLGDLVPPQGIKLTPRHYSYLKISEGCNHKCSFCIIPTMRGRLVSRPVGDVLEEAERLVAAGVKELLVISQDTSAYGSDIRYRTGFWGGKPIKASFAGLCEALSRLGVWIRLHYVYPYPHVDAVACDYNLVDDSEHIIEQRNVAEHPIACGLMFKTDSLVALGLYDEQMLFHEDTDLRIRFTKDHSITRIELPLYRYRRHDGNMTNDQNSMDRYANRVRSKHG